MAVEHADPHADLSPLDDALGGTPDSGPLGISTHTDLASGIPPARLSRDRDESSNVLDHELTLDEGLTRLDSALAGVTRNEANLGLLLRGLKHLAATASAARSANNELLHELEQLGAQLQRSHEDEQAMRFRMSQLEQLLELLRSDAARERRFLIEQQDQFLCALLTEHEREVSDLRRLLEHASNHQANSAELMELTLQRDQARDYATRCERERDLAWQELAGGSGPSSVAPDTLRRHAPPAALPSEAQKSSSTAIAAISLRAVPVPAEGPPSRRPADLGTGYSLPGGDDVGE